MTHVFVSHATADDPFVTRIHDALERASINTWVDHKDIAPGEDWEKAIQTALVGAEYGLYVLSPRSADRVECRNEIRTLLDLGVRLYVVLIERVPKEQFPYRLRTTQYVDLTRDFDGGMTSLIAAISGDRPLDPAAPTTLQAVRVTGSIPPELTRIPMSGRDDDLRVVRGLLPDHVVSVVGVGGLGKSRLAAEVILTDEWADGAVWHVISDYSTADDALALLRDHVDLPNTAPRGDVLRAVRGRKTLVVLDNGESADAGTRQDGYAALVHDLRASSARVLITSRVAWADVSRAGREHRPHTLDAGAARQVIAAMGAYFGIPDDLSPVADRMAAAARMHPRLIEWAILKLRRFDVDKVIRELEDFTSRDVQAVLDGMIRQTVAQMAQQHGADCETALKKLCVFRGGFTYQAAGVVLGLVAGGQPSDQPTSWDRLEAMLDFLANGRLDEDALDSALTILQDWQFVTRRAGRYDIDPLVIAALGEDAAAHQAQYDYFFGLAWVHDDQQNYAVLDAESDNLTAAFERALGRDPEAALWLANECGDFLANRGRFRQSVEWFTRVAAALAGAADALRGNALNSVGNAYTGLARVEDRAANLGRAVEAYRAALVYFTPDAAPMDYAMTHNNLGNAYRSLARVEDRAANLGRAVEAYRAALAYRTPDAAPMEYAMRQNNLGNAYADLAQGEDRAANLRRAIEAFRAALVYFTPDAARLYYAMTQNNLGNAYRDLAGVEDAAENLRRAVEAYRAALVYLTPDAAPLDYAETQHGLGLALYDSGDAAGALACWREAERYYRLYGLVELANEMQRGIDAAEGGG